RGRRSMCSGRCIGSGSDHEQGENEPRQDGHAAPSEHARGQVAGPGAGRLAVARARDRGAVTARLVRSYVWKAFDSRGDDRLIYEHMSTLLALGLAAPDEPAIDTHVPRALATSLSHPMSSTTRGPSQRRAEEHPAFEGGLESWRSPRDVFRSRNC